MIRVFTSKTQKIGQLGEDLAVKHLKNKDFLIICRNYTIKQGEIDVIAKKDGALWFFEVKSGQVRDVSYETYNPAENMHPKKTERFLFAVNSYIMEKQVSCETRAALISVLIQKQEKTAKIEILDI
jgi:putative endonuclease